MTQKKILRLGACLGVSVLALGSMAACGSSSSGKETGGSIVIRAGHSATTSEPYQIGLQAFADQLSEETHGAVKVKIFPNSQLGSEDDTLKSLVNGSVGLTTVANVSLANYDEKMHVFDLPFLWDSPQAMFDAVDGPVGQSFAEPLDAQGLVLLGYYYAGERELFTKDKTVNSMADIKDMKLRVMTSDISVDSWKAFGANPTPIDYSELYTSLQTGVVDGAEAAPTNYVAQKFNEVAPHLALVKWQYIVAPLVMSKKTYDSLTPEQQKDVKKAATDSVTAERQAYIDSDEKAMATMKAAGVKITEPDRAQWIAASKSVWQKWAPKVGGMETIEKVASSAE